MKNSSVVIPKTWRSETTTLVVFVVLTIISTYLTSTNEWSIIEGEVISLGGYTLNLSLPLFWFLPLSAALTAIFRIYNVRYCIDQRGLEAKIGILGPWQRVVRIRFEDVRGVEYSQSIIDRAFGIGKVDIGTAATGEVEVSFKGVEAPNEVQENIQRERDLRVEMMLKNSNEQNTAANSE